MNTEPRPDGVADESVGPRSSEPSTSSRSSEPAAAHTASDVSESSGAHTASDVSEPAGADTASGGSESSGAPQTTDASASLPRPALEPHQVFDRVGGLPAFERLVDSFYDRVADDELMRPMYPEDLEPGKRHLALFFAQYWGGGELYGRERGHPRLRMRHAPFPITPEAALRWAEHMAAAIGEQGFDDEVDALLLDYVARATPTLINQMPDEVTRIQRGVGPT